MKQRQEIEEKYLWDLSSICPSDEVWEERFVKLKELTKKLEGFRGTLSDEGKLREFLFIKREHGRTISDLYVYARMKRDEDTTVSKYQAMSDRIETYSSDASARLAFVMPELTALSDETLDKLMIDPTLADFDVFFREVKRHKRITLSEKEERILAEVGSFADNPHDVFSMFDNADIKFPDVEDENGNAVKMSHGVYSLLLQNQNQEVRKRAFESMFGVYRDHVNTLAQVYAGNVKKDWFYSKIRGFKSSLEYSMYLEDVDKACYDMLLKAVGKATPSLHRYIALRKKVLGVETLNMYDLHVPIVKSQNIALKYEDAYDLVMEALSPLGEEYAKLLDRARNERWIDVYETKGKRSGAYSWGTYDSHPYVLLNYQETTHDVFTIAHELGHAMHSYMSNKAQPYEKAGYEIFVAEIASTVNEVLLLKHLIKSAKGEMRKYLLSYYLDMFRTTLFRQTMFAEFEQAAHGAYSEGEPLTAEMLCDLYYDLNKKYYGDAVNHNELIKYEWARIPHFYSSFYVYKYATGLTAAISIASSILNGGGTDKYFKFLSAGGSMPPLEILKLADVDMYTLEPFEKAMKEFADTLSALEDEFE